MIPQTSYYFTFYDFMESTPFVKQTMKGFLIWAFDCEDESGLANYQIPNDLSTNASIYNELMALIYGRYYKEFMVRIDKPMNEEPTEDEIRNACYEFGFKFISLLNLTYEYYVPLINFYRSAKANLMDDITATSTNTVKFNDTPQNANTGGAYEGDDYLTHFTKTSNTSSSPLESKINRLKEIQDNYKNVMADWVKEFEKLFMENV